MIDDYRTFRPGSECGQLSIGFGVTALVFSPIWILNVMITFPFGVVGLVFGLIGLRRTRGGLRKDVRRAWVGTGLCVLALALLVVLGSL